MFVLRWYDFTIKNNESLKRFSAQFNTFFFTSLLCIFQQTLDRSVYYLFFTIGHFTVVCLVTWFMTASEDGGALALIQTSLL